jgi:hypothetical protein
MARPFIAAVGEYSAAQVYAQGGFIDVALPFHQANDIIVIVCDYYPSPNIPTAPLAPSGFQAVSSATYPNVDREITSYNATVWWWYRAVDGLTATPRIFRPDAAGAADSDTHLSAIPFVLRNCVTFGDPFEGRARIGGNDIPALASTHAEALAVAFMTATHHGVTQTSASPQGYTVTALKKSFVGAGASLALQTRAIEIQTVPQGQSGFTMSDPLGGFNTGDNYGFVAIPTVTLDVGVVPITSVPIRGMARDDSGPMILGCAEEIEVFITGADYEDRIDAVRWSEVEWERVLDDVSTASVTIPDSFGGVSCCARFGGLKPWRYGLTIERDGRVIWRGPVSSLDRGNGQIKVTASDCFARFKKRLATRDNSLRFVANDAGQMFADILNTYARDAYDIWSFPVPQVTTGVAVTRNVVAREFNYAWDVAKDLLDSSIDAYVLGGCPVVFQPSIGWVFVGPQEEQYYLAGEYSSGGELVYGLFTEEAFTETPSWSINGYQQANTVWVAGADSGEAGFRKFWTAVATDELVTDGILDFVETNSLYRASEGDAEPDDSAFQRRADSLVALRSNAPAVIESVSLSAQAPINIQHLRPGSIWGLDVWDACWGQLLQASRVKRVNGRASMGQGGVEETVSVSLYPLGYVEGDL